MNLLFRIKKPFIKAWREYNQIELNAVREALDSEMPCTRQDALELQALEQLYVNRLRKLDK